MTKEGLVKEAREYLRKQTQLNGGGLFHCNILNLILGFAESREKQIQIDAEQIRALQKQNGELTDELAKKADTNHQLVEQMAKLSEENAELKQAKEGKVVERFEAYGQCRDSRRIAELEAENTELRQQYKSLLNSRNEELAEHNEHRNVICEHIESNLTKAKEYIKLLLMNCVGVYESTGKTIAEIQAEAEQFLKENA